MLFHQQDDLDQIHPNSSWYERMNGKITWYNLDLTETIATGERNSNRLVNKLEDAVDKARKKDEWRLEFMTLAMKYKEKYNEGLKAGLEQGIERGIEQGLEQGREQGLEKGRLAEIFISVQEGDYPVRRGAEKTGMSIAEFAEAMSKAGYKLPAGHRG